MIDPGLTGASDRPIPGIDNGFVAGYRVRFDEAGPDGLIRTSALLRYAQDVAWRHSEFLGFDRPWYLARGRWWVVRGVDLEVFAPIALGQTLRISTVVAGHRRIWARRVADGRLADGTLAARIVTDWVMLDDAGRLVRIPEDFGPSFTSPLLTGEILRVQLPDGLAAAGGDVSEIRFSVRPQDIDPMDHVNNAAYLDWVEEGQLAAGRTPTAAAPERAEPALPAALPRRSRLEYLASAAPGDGIVVTTRRSRRGWSSRIARAGDDLELVRAVGVDGADAEPGAPALGPLQGVPPAV